MNFQEKIEIYKDIIVSLDYCVNDYLYILDVENDEYFISPHATVRFKMDNAYFKNPVKEFKKLDDAVNVQMSPVVCEAAFSRLINHPSQNIIDKLKEFSFLNVESHSMVAQHKIGYYIMKPKSFIKEFLNNGCKSLFLRSVFKLPLPYIDIICFLKKFDKQQ